uniref:Protein kinase domain-containing protein n=1 Tax=Oryza glumipatula TaxID=40148 RepID=A0A0E0A4E3_9ORYZ
MAAAGGGGGGGDAKYNSYKAAGLRGAILEAAHVSCLEDRYALGPQLGWGQFGVIRSCSDMVTGEALACKSIAKDRLVSPDDVRGVKLEIEVMARLSGHPNVVDLKAVYEDEASVHLVMELCAGGELFHRLEERGCFSEHEAAALFRYLMEVVAHCHSKGIVHRDLKPENILLVSKSPSSPIKLADFGLATYIQPGRSLSGMVGSPFYIAPEVLAGGYNEAADVWSAGVILYILLSGIPPFWGKTKSKIFECIRSTELRFPSDPWDKVSDSAKALITEMLRRDPRQRLTAKQVLEHSWIQDHADQSQDSCGHCHEINLRGEDPGSCSFSTPLASCSRDVSFNTGGPVACQSMSEEACSPTFACRSSFSAFVAENAPSCALSGFSFGGVCEPCNAVFPSPVASMPSFSFFCGQEPGEPESSPSGDALGEKAHCDATVVALVSSSAPRTAEVLRAAVRANPSRAIGMNSRRNHTIGASEREHLDVAVAESVIRWASCTNLSTTHSLRASLANGADLRGCTIRRCGREGYGVFSTAAEAGATDEVVMVVPLDLAITPMRVLQDPLVGPRCRALFEEGGVDDRLLVTLFLMVERLRPSSLWKPYLDMLPSTFGSSIWFTEDELAELEGTTLHRATVMQRKSLQTLFDNKVKGLVGELLNVDESGSSIEVRFEDFLWANSIFWTRALNIPLPRSYVFPESLDEKWANIGDDCGDSSLSAPQREEHRIGPFLALKIFHTNREILLLKAYSGLKGTGTAITAKNISGNDNPKSSNTESIWVEGLVPGIDFCNHNVKALATWEVDSMGHVTGCPSSMYLVLADKSFVKAETEICINYGNKGNEELLYLYGFVIDNNPDDYLMIHYPVEALRQVQSADIKMKLLEIQNAELRCLLPRSLLENGFFGSCSGENKENKNNTSPFSSYSWSGQRKVPSYIEKIVFSQEFISTLRTIALQEHELEHTTSLLGEIGSNEDREPSSDELRSAIWEPFSFARMTELEEGTGTEASDSQLLEKFDLSDSEDATRSDESNETKSKVNIRSCIVYRRGQKQLTKLFLREAEHLLELSSKEEN